jgi:hypothetical protein
MQTTRLKPLRRSSKSHNVVTRREFYLLRTSLKDPQANRGMRMWMHMRIQEALIGRNSEMLSTLITFPKV